MKLKANDIKNILVAPNTFSNLNNLSNNIIAHSQLEYIEGYLIGTFGKEFKEVLDNIDDYETYEIFMEGMKKYVDSNEGCFKNNESVNKVMAYIKISLIHNINKRKGGYNIG
jgi:hypothetical protein